MVTRNVSRDFNQRAFEKAKIKKEMKLCFGHRLNIQATAARALVGWCIFVLQPK